MRLKIVVLVPVAMALVTAFMIANRQAALSEIDAGGAQAVGQRVPVLVELFTSEGCSSCPRADELLSHLEQTQPIDGAEIIALSEHVDYWNHLGWTDPYSSPLFSARQDVYARVFGVEDVYTPQMIVDGRAQFVGSNVTKARDAITKASRVTKATVTLKAGLGDTQNDPIVLEVTITGLPDQSKDAEVLLAITESGLQSSVSKGENKGRSLNHIAVVRMLEVLGKIGSDEGASFAAQPRLRIEKNWKQQNVKAVVFVQQRRSKQVLGAGWVSLGA